MKKFPTLALLLSLGTALTVPAYAQDAKDILAKMIDAQGGRKILETLQDTTISGSMEMVQMGLSGSLTMVQKEPDRMRIDIEIMGLIITQAFDGEKAWMTDPQSGATQEMPEALGRDMKRQALGNDAALNPEKYGISYAFKGREKAGDKDCFVLEQTFKDGQTATLFIDAATYLLHKSKARTQDPMGGGEVDTETFFDDYRKVGDTTAAHRMVSFQNGTEQMRMTFSKIVYNTKLEDAFFKMAK